MLKNGRTPLHICADFGQVDVIKYLISEGADVNVGDAAAAIHTPARLLGRTHRLSAPAGIGQTRAHSAPGSRLREPHRLRQVTAGKGWCCDRCWRADEVTRRRTKGPLTWLCGGGAAVECPSNAAAGALLCLGAVSWASSPSLTTTPPPNPVGLLEASAALRARCLPAAASVRTDDG